VLDSYAVIAMLKHESAGPRVRQLIAAGDGVMCSVNIGEVLYEEVRRLGQERVLPGIESLRRRVHVIEPDWPLVRAAALIKARRKLAYADAFCVATAQRVSAPLWTGDAEIIALADEVDVVDLREQT
jgi:PIN domain nuclease of toxin-antitoxin system